MQKEEVRMDKLFERICIVAVIIILATITWAMWRPVSQNQQIIKVVQNQNTVLQRHEQDISLLKKDVMRKVPEAETKK